MTVLPLGDVKSHLSELVGRVHDQHERVTVTVRGRPSAILIAPEDLEALEETLAIMRDAATMNRLAESDAEPARGEYVSAEELAETIGPLSGYPVVPLVDTFRASMNATRNCRRSPGSGFSVSRAVSVIPAERSSDTT